MIKLEQYKETIHKCSKCGLCQEGCPLYLENGNECETARGILILLKGIILGEVPIKSGINKYLDKCLRCGKCSACCPSEIPVEDIIFAAKFKYLYRTLGGIKIRIKQSALWEKLFHRKKKVISDKFETKVIYLGENINEVLKTLNAQSIELLNKQEEDWGKHYLLSGNIIRFRKRMYEIVRLIKLTNPKYIITDIPTEKYMQIIKTYTGINPNLELKYLGDFENTEKLVSKYFNPYYTEKLIPRLKAKASL